MLRGILAEFQKARRRHDLLVIVLLAFIALVWSAGSAPDSDAELAAGFSGLFYGLPIIHALVMPVGMATLASRLWDAETKGSTCKLLFTLQSRGSLYLSKAVLGVLDLLLLAVVEGIGIVMLGGVNGYTEVLDRGQLLWVLGCTAAVDAMLFFAFSLLALRSSNQILLLGVGLGCSLCGFYASLMPPVAVYCLPFAWFVPLNAMQMTWNAATRTAVYTPLLYPFWLLALVLLLAAAVFAAGLHIVADQEV